MKTYIKLNGSHIAQLLDCRDDRYQYIIDNINLEPFTLVDLTPEQMDEINSDIPYDYINGKAERHIKTAEEIATETDMAITKARHSKLAAITDYDQSAAVNGFTISGREVWLDRDTRVSLARTFELETAAGKNTTTLWYDKVEPPMCFDLPLSSAQSMLGALEIYAKECYNATQRHKAAIYTLTSVASIESYNYTTGYPPKLAF